MHRYRDGPGRCPPWHTRDGGPCVPSCMTATGRQSDGRIRKPPARIGRQKRTATEDGIGVAAKVHRANVHGCACTTACRMSHPTRRVTAPFVRAPSLRQSPRAPPLEHRIRQPRRPRPPVHVRRRSATRRFAPGPQRPGCTPRIVPEPISKPARILGTCPCARARAKVRARAAQTSAVLPQLYAFRQTCLDRIPEGPPGARVALGPPRSGR